MEGAGALSVQSGGGVESVQRAGNGRGWKFVRNMCEWERHHNTGIGVRAETQWWRQIHGKRLVSVHRERWAVSGVTIGARQGGKLVWDDSAGWNQQCGSVFQLSQ